MHYIEECHLIVVVARNYVEVLSQSAKSLGLEVILLEPLIVCLIWLHLLVLEGSYFVEVMIKQLVIPFHSYLVDSLDLYPMSFHSSSY